MNKYLTFGKKAPPSLPNCTVVLSSPKIRIYADLASQPSRAIIAFCKFNKIPYEIKMTRIFKGENRAE